MFSISNVSPFLTSQAVSTYLGGTIYLPSLVIQQRVRRVHYIYFEEVSQVLWRVCHFQWR